MAIMIAASNAVLPSLLKTVNVTQLASVFWKSLWADTQYELNKAHKAEPFDLSEVTFLCHLSLPVDLF